MDMDTLIVTVPLLVTGVAIILAAAWLAFRDKRQRGWLDTAIARTVIVHTAEDESLSGSLVEVTDDGLVLRHARHLGTGEQVKGEVWVPRPSVIFVQVV